MVADKARVRGAPRARLEPLAGSDFVQEEAEMEAELVEGIHALIVGALQMLDRRP